MFKISLHVKKNIKINFAKYMLKYVEKYIVKGNKMVTYSKNELVGVTEFSKSVSSFVEKVSSGIFDKIAIVKRNKPEVVIIPIEEYERLKSQDIQEDLAIAKIIKKRVLERDEPVKMLTHEEMMTHIEKRLKNV